MGNSTVWKWRVRDAIKMFIARRLQKFVFVIVFIFFFKGAAATRWQQLIVAASRHSCTRGDRSHKCCNPKPDWDRKLGSKIVDGRNNDANFPRFRSPWVD